LAGKLPLGSLAEFPSQMTPFNNFSMTQGINSGSKSIEAARQVENFKGQEMFKIEYGRSSFM
jgi:hypothetical protein